MSRWLTIALVCTLAISLYVGVRLWLDPPPGPLVCGPGFTRVYVAVADGAHGRIAPRCVRGPR